MDLPTVFSWWTTKNKLSLHSRARVRAHQTCGRSYVLTVVWSCSPTGVESITTWPQSKTEVSFVVRTTVRSWRERPLTWPSPEVPGRSRASSFILFFRAGSYCTTPCSPLCDPVSISKSSSFINVSTFILSNNGLYIISLPPMSLIMLNIDLFLTMYLLIRICMNLNEIHGFKVIFTFFLVLFFLPTLLTDRSNSWNIRLIGYGLRDGPEKSNETRKRWKNTRKLHYICYVFCRCCKAVGGKFQPIRPSKSHSSMRPVLTASTQIAQYARSQCR